MFAYFFDNSLYAALWMIIFGGWIVTTAIWCLAMMRALQAADPHRQYMRPEQSWLCFIPGFGLYWQFHLTIEVANAFRDEFRRRSYIPREAKPGLSAGLSACILFCFVIVPPFGILVTIASFIPRIIHLVRIGNYTKELIHLAQVQRMQSLQQEQYDTVVFYPGENQEPEHNDPQRFMPPEPKPEEDLDRWRRKD